MNQNNQNLPLSTVSSSALPNSYNILPQMGVNLFVGRTHELDTLHQLLQRYDQVAIAGIAGVGKTELVLQYAKANFNHYTGGICWFLDRSDLGVQIVEFARLHFCDFTIPDKLTPTTQVQYCWQHWTPIEGDILIVIDNVSNYSQIQPYLPPLSSRFKILITTAQQLEQPVPILPLDVLTPSDALELLASRIGKYRVNDTRGKPFVVIPKQRRGKNTVVPPLSQEGQGVGEQLCELLDYLPLGVELVGRYLEQERNLSLGKMRSRLQKQLLTRKAIVELEDKTNITLTTHPSVAAAFELSWQRLTEEARDLGCLLSLFALAPIPWAQVESVVGQLYLPGALLGKLLDSSPTNSHAKIENLIQSLLENLKKDRQKLEQLHLLYCTGEECYQLHSLIRGLFREKLEKLELSENIKHSFCQVMVAVAKQIPDSPTRDLIETVTSAVPHVVEAVTQLRGLMSEEELIELFDGLGWFYQSQGFYDQAAPWREQSLSLTQTRLGSDHPDVATQLNNLAWIYYAQARYTEAEPLSVQALKICEQQLGSEHPLTIATRKNLETLRTVLKK
jgi:tetratricopeptide (TPR) repeat protein